MSAPLAYQSLEDLQAPQRKAKCTRNRLLVLGFLAIAATMGVLGVAYRRQLFGKNPNSNIYDVVTACHSDAECLKLGEGWHCDIEHLTPDDVGHCVQSNTCKENADCPSNQMCYIHTEETVGECGFQARTDIPVATRIGGGDLPSLTPLEYGRLVSANRVGGLLKDAHAAGGCGTDRAARTAMLMGLSPADNVCAKGDVRCDRGPCDEPRMRDSYANPTQPLHMEVTFHLMTNPDGSLPVSVQDMAAAVQTLHHNYAPAKISFTGKFVTYQSMDLAGALVGTSPADCQLANDLLRHKREVMLFDDMLVMSSMYTNETVLLSAKDTVFLNLTSKAWDRFTACIVRCESQHSCGPANRESLWCGEAEPRNGYSVSTVMTLGKAGYYAVWVENSNNFIPSTIDMDIQWRRNFSCFMPLEWTSALDKSWNVAKPWNVYVANFVPAIVNETHTRVRLNGFAHFPWSGPDTQGVVFMNPTRIGAGMATLGHEMGHGMGLWHTFHGVSEIGDDPCHKCAEHPDQSSQARDYVGDLCGDTMPMPRNWDCFETPGNDPCTGAPWKDTPFDNFMSYGSDECRQKFTPQQVSRVRCWIEHSPRPFF